MKKGIVLAGLCLTSMTFSATAAIPPTIEKTLIAVCKSVTKDNVLQFNRTIKEHKINKKLIFPKLVCNGQSIHDFALAQGANKVAEHIARYSKNETLAKL